MITGYYVRGSRERWQLIRQDERYEGEVVADDLSNEEAVALYWRRMAELVAPPATADAAPRREPECPPQLSLDL